MKTQVNFAMQLLSVLSVIALTGKIVSAADVDKDMRGQFSAADYKFACAAASGGAMEVNLGKLAVQKSSNAAVKQFGQKMVDDHGKAGTQLQTLAAGKGATLPAQPTAMQQKKIDHLQGLAGTEFDNAYVAMMVHDHKADLKAFKQAAEKSEDADLKAFAASTAPVVEEHLRMVESIESNSQAADSIAK